VNETAVVEEAAEIQIEELGETSIAAYSALSALTSTEEDR
jgi:hypothetical protein